MHALFFEVWPNEGHESRYFDHVNRLKPALEKHDGLLWLDRYRAISNPAKLLSHQLWRDDAAIVGWRQDREHKAVQRAGRETHFEDYRIRVAQLVLRIEGVDQTHFDTKIEEDHRAVLVLSGNEEFKGQMSDPYSSINREDAYIDLAEGESVAAFCEQLKEASSKTGFSDGFVALVKRDYSLLRRGEAPCDDA